LVGRLGDKVFGTRFDGENTPGIELGRFGLMLLGRLGLILLGRLGIILLSTLDELDGSVDELFGVVKNRIIRPGIEIKVDKIIGKISAVINSGTNKNGSIMALKNFKSNRNLKNTIINSSFRLNRRNNKIFIMVIDFSLTIPSLMSDNIPTNFQSTTFVFGFAIFC